jgi:hypothetical protein
MCLTILNDFRQMLVVFKYSKRSRGRDRMVVGKTTTYSINAYHHWCYQFESRSGRGVQHYVIKFVSDLRVSTGRWFSPGTPVSSTNKTERHDITEILLNTIKRTNLAKLFGCPIFWLRAYLIKLTPLTWVWIPLRRGLLNTTLCDKVCQWLVAGLWFSPGTPVSSTNKTDHHNITEILLKVALNTINLYPSNVITIFSSCSLQFSLKLSIVFELVTMQMFSFSSF